LDAKKKKINHLACYGKNVNQMSENRQPRRILALKNDSNGKEMDKNRLTERVTSLQQN
jgi:hypothetical protein